MERSRSIEVASRVGQRAQVMGWLHALRRVGRNMAFVLVRDGWGITQAVATSEGEIAPLEGLAVESVIALQGTVAVRERGGGHELVGPLSIEVITPVHAPPVIALGGREIHATLPALLDHATVANRHPQRRALFALAAGAMAGFRATLNERGFTEIQSPKIVASATEGGANVFALDYFGRRAFLAQSPQFYKQVMVGVFERVYEVGPVFRAEPHATVRHLAEYVSLDAEMGFVESHVTVMATLRDVLAGILATLGARHSHALETLGVALPEVPAQIPSLHFTEALAIAARATGEACLDEPDLAPAHERALGEWARREHNSEWLFVTGYPMRKRPFYTHPEPGRPSHSNSFDLLFRGTELVTGGQRLHRHADYVAALDRAGMPHEPFAHYLEAFAHGMPPHGGFAIGLERLITQLTGVGNVRLASLFPRDLHRVAP